VDVIGFPIPGTNPIQAEVTQELEQIDFVDFDAQGPIHPGGFDLRMQCNDGEPIPGEREVRWRVTYMDDDMERGYITECSATVVFVGSGQPRIKGLPTLDSTSRKARNDAFNEYLKDKASAVAQSDQVGRFTYRGLDWVARKQGNSVELTVGPLCSVDGSVLRHFALWGFLREVTDDLRLSMFTRLFCPECERKYAIDPWDIPGHTIGELRAAALHSLRLREVPRIR
jgi:hypothetical protein